MFGNAHLNRPCRAIFQMISSPALQSRCLEPIRSARFAHIISEVRYPKANSTNCQIEMCQKINHPVEYLSGQFFRKYSQSIETLHSILYRNQFCVGMIVQACKPDKFPPTQFKNSYHPSNVTIFQHCFPPSSNRSSPFIQFIHSFRNRRMSFHPHRSSHTLSFPPDHDPCFR